MTESEIRQVMEQVLDEKLTMLVDTKLREIVREESRKLPPHRCRFEMSENEADAMSKYVKNISRLSDDKDLEGGLDLIRDNHKWIASMRNGGSKAASAFYILLITTAASAFLVMIWEGFRVKVLGK